MSDKTYFMLNKQCSLGTVEFADTKIGAILQHENQHLELQLGIDIFSFYVKISLKLI